MKTCRQLVSPGACGPEPFKTNGQPKGWPFSKLMADGSRAQGGRLVFFSCVVK